MAILQAIWNSITSEPNLTAGFVRALILCAVTFGLQWTPEQIGATMLVLESFLTMVTRQAVTPNKDVGLTKAEVVQANAQGFNVPTKLPIVLLAVALSLVSLPGCGKLKGDTHPDSVTAHFGADILDIVGDVQRTVIDAYKAHQIPATVSDPIMQAAGDAIPYAEKLDAALQVYHSAASLDAQKLAQANIADLVSKLEAASAKMFGVKLPEGAPARILSLALKLRDAVQAVRRQFLPPAVAEFVPVQMIRWDGKLLEVR